MNKKLIFSIGSLVTIAAPIAAVVSCGKITVASDKELDNYRKFSTAESLRLFEEQWQEQTMETLKADGVNFGYWDITIGKDSNGNDDISKNKWEYKAGARDANGQYTLDVTKSKRLKDVAQFIIKQEIAKNKSFLNTFATQLLGDKVSQWYTETNNGKIQESVNTPYLQNNGMAKVYEIKDNAPQVVFGTNADGTEVTDDAINLMLNYPKSDFRYKVYAQIISEEYLLHTNLNEYKIAFPGDANNISLIQRDIDESAFVLINEELSQKLFAKWSIELKGTDANSFIGKEYSYADALTAMKENGATVGELAHVLTWSAKRSRAFDELLPVADKYNEITGWKGIEAQGPIGTKRLSFTRDELHEVTANTEWEGFVQDENLITSSNTVDKIKAVPDGKTDGAITFIKGLMPVYENNKFVNKFDAKLIARLLAYKDSSKYSKAAEFFRTEVKGRVADDNTTDASKAIYLKLTDNAQPIKSILENKGFNFIKARDAE